MREVLVNRLGGLSLPRKSVVRLTDRPDMTLDVYCGRKTTIQQQYSAELSMLFIYNLGAWFESMQFAISTMYEFTVSILKEISGQTD